MRHINPQTLKHLREKKGLSQQKLAEAVDVAPKTISRLEQDKDFKKPHPGTVQKLADALGTSVEDLARPLEAAKDGTSEDLGHKRTYIYRSSQERMHDRFLEARYGVTAHSIQKAAPLLFLILAEWSLQERRIRVAELEDALFNVPTDKFAHLQEARIGVYRAEEAAWAERASITARDLSGKAFREDQWSEDYKGNGDLFTDFLSRKARELCPDVAAGDQDEIYGPFEALDLRLFSQELQRLAPGGGKAALALIGGDVHPRDIPADLLEDGKDAARAAWLAEQCGDEARSFLGEMTDTPKS